MGRQDSHDEVPCLLFLCPRSTASPFLPLMSLVPNPFGCRPSVPSDTGRGLTLDLIHLRTSGGCSVMAVGASSADLGRPVHSLTRCGGLR